MPSPKRTFWMQPRPIRCTLPPGSLPVCLHRFKQGCHRHSVLPYRVMRSPMLSVVVVAFLFNAACASVATKSVNVEARVAAQNALFEEWYQADLKAHPEQATAYGDYRYNDRLDGRSLAALSAEHANDQYFIAHLRAIPTTGFS